MARTKPRWGRVKELDKRIHVGTDRFRQLPRRLQQLAAWRRMNSKGHNPVKMYGTRIRVRPSSDIPLKKKILYCQKKIK